MVNKTSIAKEVWFSIGIALISVALLILTGEWIVSILGAFLIPFPYAYQFSLWEQEEWSSPGCSVQVITFFLAGTVALILFAYTTSQQNWMLLLQGLLHSAITFCACIPGMIVTIAVADRIWKPEPN